VTAFSPALHRFGDVTVRLSVELGRADMALRDVIALGPGSVVALDRMTDELLDVTANGKVIARGEVVAKDGRFALRIVSLVGDDEIAEPGAGDAPAAPFSDNAAGADAARPPQAETPASAPSPGPGSPNAERHAPDGPQP